MDDFVESMNSSESQFGEQINKTKKREEDISEIMEEVRGEEVI